VEMNMEMEIVSAWFLVMVAYLCIDWGRWVIFDLGIKRNLLLSGWYLKYFRKVLSLKLRWGDSLSNRCFSSSCQLQGLFVHSFEDPFVAKNLHFHRTHWWNNIQRLNRALLFLSFYCLVMGILLPILLLVLMWFHSKNNW
jgi:hypothetical protein